MLKILSLKKKLPANFVGTGKVLIDRDFMELPNSLIPGEWVILQESEKLSWVAFINTMANNGVRCHPIRPLRNNECEQDLSPENIIDELLEKAIGVRELLYSNDDNFRVVFGINDSMPGLVVDKYTNCLLMQVTTAGLDRFRGRIKRKLETCFDLKVIILDKESLRKNEYLPTYQQVDKIDNILVNENGLIFDLPYEMIQKNGFYFDHALNRLKLGAFLERYQGDINNGLDLFCYTGSWGMHLLRSGVREVTFVDQGDYKKIISKCIETSVLSGEHEFIRSDVFKYLDDMSNKDITFDIIVSDPPAFSKSKKNINNALRGYRKLYKKIIPRLNNRSLLVVASCTHGVSLQDLSLIISDTCLIQSKRCCLLDVGIQGPDHFINQFESKGYYLKYLLYLIEEV